MIHNEHTIQRPFAIVTSATEWFGSELAKQFASKGFDLLVTSKDDTVHAIRDELLKYGVFVESYVLDLSTFKGVELLREHIKSFGHPVDALAFYADEGPEGPFLDTDMGSEFAIVRQNILDPDKVLVKAITNIDLQGAKQFFEMGIKTDIAVDLENFLPGSIIIGLDFRRVALQLPRLSGKELPPQFLADSRIKTKPPKTKIEIQAEEAKPVIVKLKAQGAQALQIESNLLDEPLRLNLDLLLQNAVIENGHVDILPFRTTVFKRPIVIPNMRVTFHPPMGPVIQGTIIFKLPEYKITLSLKGPISKPRHAFTSSPPLPQNDIYAVLLFGRPMAELNPDDKSASQKTGQLLSQGILSLSVLYFLAGSPVEYVGLDPETGGATAQFGLGSKSSLRVGGGDTGVNSTAVRRSLGKGWYLDTSVQNSNSVNATQERTYGVLLERIIAY